MGLQVRDLRGLRASSRVTRGSATRRAARSSNFDELPDACRLDLSDQAEQREQLGALEGGDRPDLTPRQREVFVAVALNDVPIDVLAIELGSNRNAIYKNLFDARRKLRGSLAAADYPLTDEELSA